MMKSIAEGALMEQRQTGMSPETAARIRLTVHTNECVCRGDLERCPALNAVKNRPIVGD